MISKSASGCPNWMRCSAYDVISLSVRVVPPVQSVEGIEHDRGRTCAGKGGRNFAADVSRFSHPEDHDLSAGIDRPFQQFDGIREILPETLTKPLQLKNLDFEHACTLFKVVHQIYN